MVKFYKMASSYMLTSCYKKVTIMTILYSELFCVYV